MIDKLWQYSEAELAAEAQANEQEIRCLLARQSALLAEIESRGPMATFGYADTVGWQIDVLNIGRPEAKRRAQRARWLHPTRAGAGAAVMPPLAPMTGAAASGAIGPEHVDQIIATLNELPGTVTEEVRRDVEARLVELATQVTPQMVAKAGRHTLALLDQDGKKPKDDELAKPERNYAWRGAATTGSASPASWTKRPGSCCRPCCRR